jgi:phosphoribosyl 1,2-cyclic phosphodiesterase
MYIKCWGSRGSIAVSGAEYLKYGGDTTCMEIRTQSGDIIVVDAGTGIRRLGSLLTAERHKRIHLIFTHAHLDHICGFPFFNPLFQPEVEIRMYRCPFNTNFGKAVLSSFMAAPYFPIPYSKIRAQMVYPDACPRRFQIGSVTIDPIGMNHPNGGSGYKFTENGKSFVFLTDNELGFQHQKKISFQDYVDFARHVDLLIHDGEYTPEEYTMVRGWGHSTYTDAVKLAVAADVKQLGIFHANQERTDREMDDIAKRAKKILIDQGSAIECTAVSAGMTFNL